MKYGGIEKSLLNTLRYIDYEKYDVDLLLIEGKGEYFEDLPSQLNIIYKDLTNTYGSFAESALKSIKKKDKLSLVARFVFLGSKLFHPNLLRFLRKPLLGDRIYDFAIGYRYGICTDIVQYTVRAKNKATWWHHGEISISENQIKEFEKVCIKLKNLVVVSEACEKMLLDAMPDIKNLITVIPNMIDQKNINSLALEFSPDFDKEYVHFATACRFAPEKHIENVVLASEILVRNGFKNFKWHLIGDGEDLEELQNFAEQKKVSKQIIFEGKKTNPFPYLKKADIYVHTSYVESQGLSILEAMELNTPCIITDNSGIRDYANSNNSIIVKQGAEFLADAIIDLVQNENKYNILKQNTKCPEKFYSKNIIRKIDQFLF